MNLFTVLWSTGCAQTSFGFYFTDVLNVMHFSVYWDYAMTIPLEEIVYLHCHQQGGSTQSLTLIVQLCV